MIRYYKWHVWPFNQTWQKLSLQVCRTVLVLNTNVTKLGLSKSFNSMNVCKTNRVIAPILHNAENVIFEILYKRFSVAKILARLQSSSINHGFIRIYYYNAVFLLLKIHLLLSPEEHFGQL
jgi:hypothetical protein